MTMIHNGYTSISIELCGNFPNVVYEKCHTLTFSNWQFCILCYDDDDSKMLWWFDDYVMIMWWWCYDDDDGWTRTYNWPGWEWAPVAGQGGQTCPQCWKKIILLLWSCLGLSLWWSMPVAGQGGQTCPQYWK